MYKRQLLEIQLNPATVMVLPADKQVQWFQGQHCYKHGSDELFELTALFILPAGQILLGIMLLAILFDGNTLL